MEECAGSKGGRDGAMRTCCKLAKMGCKSDGRHGGGRSKAGEFERTYGAQGRLEGGGSLFMDGGEDRLQVVCEDDARSHPGLHMRLHSNKPAQVGLQVVRTARRPIVQFCPKSGKGLEGY